MALSVKILENRYIDSVSLMAMSTQANEIEGVDEVIIAMATEMNKEVMKNVGLYNDEIKNASSSDLVIVANIQEGYDELEVQTAIESVLVKKKKVDENISGIDYTTIKSAKANYENANLALISVNGQYAAREAFQALYNGLNVMMFSDNVDLEAEIELKKLAHEKGLLMMGPDCGTAIINNVGLGFANKVRKGSIGVVGASGTGSQEVSVRIHEFGEGISQLIGTGGRDLSKEVGGRMMLDGMKILEADPETKVILLVSKPPAEEVEKLIIDQAQALTKPVVIWFIGSDKSGNDDNVYFESMSKNASLKAVELAGVDIETLNKKTLNLPLIEEVRAKLNPEQKYIRGLFVGGTLCAESMAIAESEFSNVYSNITHDESRQLKDLKNSIEHTFIDLGSDEYTDGKPHPMIDPSNRVARFHQEAQDPEVAVIILDFVLGYGSHEDPVGMMSQDIKEAIDNAKEAGRHLEVLGYILGTDMDEQNLEKQIDKLIATGATHASSSQNAGLLAKGYVSKV